MTDAFIGEIRILPYTFAPVDWGYCNGQLIPISQNQALFAIIGGTFGGDWRVSMGLPNLKARSPMGTGTGPGLTPRTLGEYGGIDGVTLYPQNMPNHDHTAYAYKQAGSQAAPQSTFFEGGPKSTTRGKGYAYGPPDTNLTDMADEAMAYAGASYPHENRQPVLGTVFCMALEGMFPSRN